MTSKAAYLFLNQDWRMLPSLIAGTILFGCVSSNLPVTATPTADIETIDEFFARCPTVDEVSRVNADLILHFDYAPR